MDLDDIDKPSQVPARTRKFAPKVSNRLKPKSDPVPKSEPQQPNAKPGPQQPITKPEPQQPINKPEQDFDSPVVTKAVDEEVKVVPKVEQLASNGFVKMEGVPKSEVEEESMINDPMELEDSEDMVVREIDVFFTPSVESNTQLYVLQYPLKPCWRPYELDKQCEAVRVKTGSAEVEVDLRLDTDDNYDTSSRFNMTKQTLACAWKPPRTTGYVVGMLVGNKLHLNPVHAVVQLRPSFEYLNPGVKQKNDIGPDGEVKREKSSGEKLVGSLEKQNKQTESSTKRKSEDEECWIPLKYHGSESDLSETYLKKMASQESSPIQFTMNPHDYVNSLCPGTLKDNSKPKCPSRRSLLSLPLNERIKKLLTEGPPVHRFSALMHFVPDYGAEELLEALQQHALLVQGFWAPKSGLLFPGDAAECLARDFTLVLFSKNPVIPQQLAVSKGLREKINRFLNIFAVKRPSLNDWKFKEPSDTSFMKLHSDIVQKQAKVWEAIEEKISNFISTREKSAPSRTAISKPNMISKPVKIENAEKGATKSVCGAVSWRTTMSDDTREALPKALHRVFQNHKVCSFQLICQGLRDLAVSQSSLPKADARTVVAAAHGVDAPPDDLKEIISEVATEIHGLYVLTSSPEHPEFDPLRKIVIELLRGIGPNAMLKRADVSQAAKLKLGRDITNHEYNKVMNEICVSKGSAWVLKSDGDSK